jgi:hypothetical protein
MSYTDADLRVLRRSCGEGAIVCGVPLHEVVDELLTGETHPGQRRKYMSWLAEKVAELDGLRCALSHPVAEKEGA